MRQSEADSRSTVRPADDRRTAVMHVITRMIVGGAQENTLDSCARVAPDEFQSVLVTGPQTGPEGSLLEETRARGVPLVVDDALRREISPLRDVVVLRRLWSRMRRERPTIVHTHSSKAGILGRLAARLARVPVVVHTVHGWSFHEHMHALVRRAYIALERLTARWSDALVVVAESDREKGLAHRIGRPAQYRLIRSGVDLAPFREPGIDTAEARRRLGVPVDAPVVGNVGRLSPQKDPHAFVRVAAAVRAEHPDAWFVLVGDGPLRDEVTALAEEVGVADRLVLPGLRRDVPQLLPAFDVIVFTSRWEGLPRVVPQSLAAGVPVVATAADGVAEALTSLDAGICVPVGDEDGLACAVNQLLAAPERRATLAERGAEASEEFELDRMIEQLTELYRVQLAAQGRKGR